MQILKSKLEDLLPASPKEGPPLPKGLKMKWKNVAETLAKLPFEDEIDRVLNTIARIIEEHPLTKPLQEIKDKLPVLPEIEIPTPLGKFLTPLIELPNPLPPKIDERRREAVKGAIADDIASILEKIPLLHPVADTLEDIAIEKLHNTLTDTEYRLFRKYDKICPITTLALLQTFAKERRGK